MFRRLLLTVFVAVTIALPYLCPAAASLISNGDFETSRDGRTPADWPLVEGASWASEGTNHFLHLTSPKPGANVMVYRAVPLPAGTRALELTYSVRFRNIKRGKQPWFDGRIIMNFKDAAKQAVTPNPPHPSFNGTADTWRTRTNQFRVPEGAVMIEFMPSLFGAESGELDLDDIHLAAIAPEVIAASEAAAEAKKAGRIAALPKPKVQVAPPSPDKLPKPLHVAGNQLRNSANQAVWLQGLAVPSMEWTPTGEHVLESISVGITNWKANCIRLPVNDKFWTGTGPHQNDGGAKYRQLVEDAVNLCAGLGAYLVIDLHEYRAPRQKHAEFWKDVATRYKNHPAVLFELLNEPHDISWEIWRNGGPVSEKKKKTDAVAENPQALTTFESVGMQKLVDVIRETGAQNVIVAGGLDWGYDLSGVLKGFALEDRTGHGIIYSSHVYPWKNDWQHKFLDAAEKYPLFIGEVGADTQKMSFLPADKQENPTTWAPDILGVIQKYRLNWTAWAFHPTAGPRALQDWNYTPTPFWGVPVKEALSGKTFTTQRLR